MQEDRENQSASGDDSDSDESIKAIKQKIKK